MGDTSSFINNGFEHAKKAIEWDKKACADNEDPELFENAKNAYIRAIEYYMTGLKYEKNDRVKSSLKAKISNYMDRVDILKEWLKKYNDNKQNPNSDVSEPTGSGNTATKKDSDANGAGKEKERMQSQLGAAILTEKPNVKWDDVAGLGAAKDALKEAVILPQRFPQMFTGKRKPWKGILLYGPPGTGKSYLAKAVATEADAKFFSVSSSDLVSKWQGESEKLVKELFGMARKEGKAIIFIDEIDALVSTRSDSESESSRRIKTEFLVQMDGVGKSTDGVLLLGATNIPWGLDDALLRRMERRVYIPLPDAEARKTMFQIHLGQTPNELSDEDFVYLSERSEGYSGSDIAVAVRDAIMGPVRKLQNARFFKKSTVNGVEKFTPVRPPLEGEEKPAGIVQMDLMQIKPDTLEVPQVTIDDFEEAFERTNPSVGRENIIQHEKFTKEKGQSGV